MTAIPAGCSLLAKLERADLLDFDESIAKAMVEEKYEGGAFLAKPEAKRRWELL